MTPTAITDALIADLEGMRFGPPVTHVYNPLLYARAGYDEYFRRYDGRPKEVVFLGMNPGPWGMAQTGVPFGEVAAVRTWLGIEVEVGQPARPHPRRPVTGFSCPRSEISGKRFWGWARENFKTPQGFFDRFFVINYCPLLFIEKSGRNRTPSSLPAYEKETLFVACDRALLRMAEWLQPRQVVGVGRFAEQRAREALAGMSVRTGGITHPSPANPKANQGWGALVLQELREQGIRI